MSTVVAVPVKDLVNAKQRLTAALAPAQRATLARAMLRDVLRALRAAPVDAVWIVTRDPEVTALARAAGAVVLGEAENRGHTAAVAHAQARAAEQGARVFTTVPGDVPCISAAEIAELLDAARSAPAAVFAPSRSGLGTNGVALSPADVMPLTFGEPSFQNHLDTAARLGLVPRIVRLPGLALDVDDASDLRALLALGPHTESAGLVGRWLGSPAAPRGTAGRPGAAERVPGGGVAEPDR
jgi:2-phospho-L-lactate guanylyltransferase